MAIKNPVVNKIFEDLEAFKDWCRFNGKVFDEANLYKNRSPIWREYSAQYTRPQRRNKKDQ